ncbi:sulfatase family protein [Novipirellula artificiosorum]|uniref:Arylsulfatase n=1 Tax=Novipirellula artificiosorum TaxID=2528016 RepID=A0A5C6E0H0_9BACT|nr:sulfatase-like hydrolase/transferase [Novipirellula artificiosorum]TWU40649.1 Arylsulfatase [Novipirellula artificiosorum]
MMNSITKLTLLLLCVCASLRDASAAEPEPKPNIVFLLADDLGYGDLGCYGHPYARTPNLDQLAKDGTRFAQFYATGMTCCPARTGLMTSQFPATYPTYPANGGFAERVTITELLNKSGYRTGHFGKWHIGPDQKPGTYGIDVVGDQSRDERGKKKAEDLRGRDAPIYDQAIRFIEESKGQPFYVNVWGHISHNPVDPNDELVQRWSALELDESKFSPAMREKFATLRKAGGDVEDALRRYLADVESLDAAVGQLLKRLDELGLRDNTIVIFNSDQGADMSKAGLGGVRDNQMGFNGAHRGGKHTNLEGGLRVPWIVRWPGHVPAGRVDEQSVISAVDYLPTLCALTGVAINAADFEGEDVSAAWLGKATHTRTRPLLWKTSSPGGQAVIREGQWKLFHPIRKNGGEFELYDIAADPAEALNLAAQQPEVLSRLKTRIEAWVATLPKEYIKTDDKED